jgi:hypothetical protein
VVERIHAGEEDGGGLGFGGEACECRGKGSRREYCTSPEVSRPASRERTQKKNYSLVSPDEKRDGPWQVDGRDLVCEHGGDRFPLGVPLGSAIESRTQQVGPLEEPEFLLAEPERRTQLSLFGECGNVVTVFQGDRRRQSLVESV